MSRGDGVMEIVLPGGNDLPGFRNGLPGGLGLGINYED